MERTSLAEALDKLNSDVAAQHAAGLDALKTWLQDPTNLEKADDDPEVWPAVLKMLDKYGKRQLENLARAGGRKGTFKVDGPAVLHQVLHHLGRNRKRKAPPGEKMMKAQLRIWSHITESLRNETLAAKQPEALFYFCKAAAELSEAAEHGALPRGRDLKTVLKVLLEVPSGYSQNAQGAALNAAASLCRYVDGDIVAEVPLICERSLALMQSCGQAAANCLGACALRAPFAFRDWVACHLENFVGRMISCWPQRQNIDQLELAMRLALNLGLDLPKREAQTLLPLVVETLEQHALADSAVERSRFRGEKTDHQRSLLRARMADLMAALLWQATGSAADAASELCVQLERRCLPWALCLVRLVERFQLDHEQLPPLMAAVLRQLQKARVEMEPALQGALAALLNAHGWMRLAARARPLPVWCSLLCPEMPCLLCSPGIVENLPALDRYECSPELAQQFNAAVDYVKAWWAQRSAPVESHFWHLAAMVFLMAADTKDLEEKLWGQVSTKTSSSSKASALLCAARRQPVGAELQRKVLEVLLTESFEHQWAFMRIASTPLPDLPEAANAVSTDWTLEMNDFYLAVPLRDAMPQAAVEGRQRRCGWFEFEGVLQRRLAMAALETEVSSRSSQGFGAGGQGAEVDEVLLHRYALAAQLQAPANWRQRQQRAEPVGTDTGAFSAAFAVFISRFDAFKDAQDPSREMDQQQLLRAAASLLPSFGLAISACSGSAGNQRMLTDCFRRTLQFACTLTSSQARNNEIDAFFASLCTLLWQVAHSGVLASSDYQNLVATLAENIGSAPLSPAVALAVLMALTALQDSCCRALRQQLQLRKEEEPYAMLTAIRFAATEICWQLNRADATFGQGAKAVPVIMEVVEAWCSCLLPISALEWELFFTSIQRILLVLEKSIETEDVKRRLMQRLWGKAERGSPSRLQAQVEALANSFHPNGRCKIALASVLTTSLRLLRPQEEVKAAADCCMSWVPDFILKDPCREVQLEVSNSCISSLFECFDSTAVFDELRPVLDFSSEILVTQNLPNSCALVAFQVAIAISCCQGYMHRVLPAFCASPPAVLRPLARKALKVLDEELGIASVEDLSPLALTFRAPIFQTLLKVKGASLTQVPLVDMGLADTTPTRPGKGQRWGFGRHLAAAVCAMVLAEDLDQVSDLAPCCGMGPKSPEFLELLLVPLAACVIPLRKSLERLHQRFGEQQVVKLLKSKASHIFAFALQLPFLTFGSPHAVDAETIAAAFREVAPQVEWLDTSAFVSKHFRELLFLLDPVIRAWSSHLPQTTLSLWRSLIAWVGPLSGSRLRLVLAMMQHTMPPKQRVELSRIVADAIAAAAAHKSNGLMKLVRHRDETLQLMLSSVEHEWSSSPPEAVRGEAGPAERSPALTALLAVLKALKAEEGVLWLQLQLEAILPRLVLEAQKLVASAAQLELPDGPRSAKRLRRGASARLTPEDALKQLAPLAPDLCWGPPSSPDVGCIVRCLPENSNDAAEEVMYASLRLLAQGSPTQLRNDPHLARALAMGLASLKPVAMKALSETSSDKLEGALSDTKYQVDDLLYSVALLGASHLQAHQSSAVRQLAGRALRHLMATQKGWCHSARNTLKNLLNKCHLACEDLEELSHLVATTWSNSIQAGSNVGRTISWQFTRQEADISSWMSGVLSHLLKLGSSVWDGSGTAVLTACAPLAKHSLWFSQRLLVLLLVKAANMPKSGSSLAKDLTGFFKQVASTSRQQPQARCLLHALHLIRVHQRAQKKRAVPHFPDDSEDPFWSSLDLFAAASCAASISDSQNAFLLLELHLQRSKPDLPLQEALESVSSRGLGVEALFQPPAREVDLLHALARQLPDDELLYGQGEWCHASSRLARAELAQDNFTSIHLRIELLESALQRNDVAGQLEARHGMDAAISRLGWHSLLATGLLPEDDVAWEKRAEALWRLRQWGPIEGMKQGFHSSVHSALSGLSSAVRTVESMLGSPGPPGAASHDFSQAVATLERPLLRTVADVVNEIQVQLPEELQQKALQLQMLGSIFQCCDALVSDVHQKTQNGQTRSVLNLASSWTSNVPVSARCFNHVEPLLALQSSILATTSHPLAEGRFLVASAAAARKADLAQRGLALLERAQRACNAKLQRQENLMLRWEQARCLYALKSPEGMSIAKALAAECRQGIQGPRAGSSNWAAQVLSCTGLWLSESRLENADVIKKDYFEASALLDPDPGSRNGRQFAEFLDNKLTEELAFQGSAGHQRTLRSRQLTEQKIQRIDEDVAKAQKKGTTAAVQKEVKDLQEQKGKLEKHRKDDIKDAQQEKERLKTLTLGCVKQLGQCLAAQDGNPGNQGGGLTQVACRFLSLWFDHNLEYDEITNIVKDAIPTLSLDAVLPFIYQLAARLEMKEPAFQRTLDELLLRLAQKGSPALWPLISLRNGAEVPKDFANGQSSFRADTSKVDAATRVTTKCRNSKTVRPVLEAVESLSRFYLAVAFHDVGMNSKDPRVRHVRIAFEKVKHFREAKQVAQTCRVPVPTAASTVAYIQQFEGEITIAPQGISIPKIVWVRDSEGRRHKQLVKGNDDLRQDAVMQQLFGLLNVVFKEDPKSLSLRLRTFQVVPLSPQAGIVEWVQETETLGEILVGSSNTDGAHQRYRPQDWDQAACRKRLGDAKELGHAQKLQALKEIYENVKPVMHLFFLERFVSPQEWHRARQGYARSTAVNAIVGYIVGLGDRHPNNILFDERTGELINIDFGIAFERGKNLQMPEMVPFRLTRDIVAGLGCLGTCGLFRRCAEAAMALLRQNGSLVTAVVEVFVHDPIYAWSCLTPKNVQREAGEAGNQSGQGVRDFSEEDGNDFARRAVVVVKDKLLGSSGHLGVSAHVQQLIYDASDLSQLCKMFNGWQQWV